LKKIQNWSGFVIKSWKIFNRLIEHPDTVEPVDAEVKPVDPSVRVLEVVLLLQRNGQSIQHQV
jgi:hypothetical protein